MNLIIHIGPHKTGSTAIQKTLLESKSRLVEDGICYPISELVEYGHHGLAGLLFKEAYVEARDMFDRMVREAESENAHSLILSSEDFSKLTTQEVAMLRSITSAYNVEILYVQRNPLNQLYSWWQEQVKHGSCEVFSQYVVEIMISNRKSAFLKPDLTLARWAKNFGRKNIKLLKYRENDDVIPIFFREALSIDEIVFIGENKNINKSFEPAEIELIRMMNVLGYPGLDFVLNSDVQYYREKLVKGSKNYLRAYNLKFSTELKNMVSRYNKKWSDRFLNLSTGEDPIESASLRIREYDPTCWLKDKTLFNELAALEAKVLT